MDDFKQVSSGYFLGLSRGEGSKTNFNKRKVGGVIYVKLIVSMGKSIANNYGVQEVLHPYTFPSKGQIYHHFVYGKIF